MSSESKDESKSTEAKSESVKVKFLNLKLNVDELDNLKVPSLDEKMFKVWENPEEISKEYIELQRMTNLVARYLAACCNEGPEVKDNISKRMILIKSILHEFLAHVAINGWMLYGLLSEFSKDIYADISGTQKTIELLKKIQKKIEERAIKNQTSHSEGYVS